MMRKSLLLISGAVAVVAAAVAGWYAWTAYTAGQLPAGVAVANGRIEVERVDVSTKLPGRVADIRIKEGDLVDAGAVVAVLDTSDLLAQRAAARAAVARATAGIAKAKADVTSAEANLALADVQLQRSSDLLDKAVSPQSLLDQRQAQRQVAIATVAAAHAAVDDAVAARDAASAQVDVIQVNIDDMALKAPTTGRIEYKLVDRGAVIAGGGKVATLLDLTDVSMTIFLPTKLVGRVALNAPARVVLDAAPEWVIPANVSFVAAEAQFTPKSVETRDEREKLMYRVKVKIDPNLLETYRAYVKSGLTGSAYLLTDPAAVWPPTLAVHLPPAGEASK
jgi:HlyD family secretion protein